MPSTPELDWDDTTDQADATRGLIDKLEPCVVRNEIQAGSSGTTTAGTS